MGEWLVPVSRTGGCGCAPGGVLTTLTAQISVCGPRTDVPAVLWLPPGPGIGHQIIRALGAALTGAVRPLLVEYPGHGAGAHPPRDREALVADLVLAAEAAGDPVLLGHSWGADLAVTVAARRPPPALVLISPPPTVTRAIGWTDGSSTVRQRVAGRTSHADWFRRYLLDYALPLGLANDRERARRLLADVPTFDLAWRMLRRTADPLPLPLRLRGLSIPTLVLYGRQDDLLDRADMAAMAELDRVTIVGVPGGHYPYLDSPVQTRAAVVDFVADVLASVHTDGAAS
ncbi:MAG TPA: alpha/beta hydrolase [Pseudonocardiaceae bacterium]|nr:alpha/beta hydrolase [Pseudonocardiaceae bacterium]